MSIATLKRRIEYGLKRRNVRHDLNSAVRNKIRSLLDPARVRSMDPTAWEAIDIFGTLSRCKVLVFPVLCSETFAVMFTNFFRDVHKLFNKISRF